MGKKQNKKSLKQKGSETVQEDNKKKEVPESVEDNNSSTEQEQLDNQENTQEPVTKEKGEPKKDKPAQTKSKLISVKGKVAEKGLKSFLRCGVKFTDEYQELEIDKVMLTRLKSEPKLTIQVVK